MIRRKSKVFKATNIDDFHKGCKKIISILSKEFDDENGELTFYTPRVQKTEFACEKGICYRKEKLPDYIEDFIINNLGLGACIEELRFVKNIPNFSSKQDGLVIKLTDGTSILSTESDIKLEKRDRIGFSLDEFSKTVESTGKFICLHYNGISEDPDDKFNQEFKHVNGYLKMKNEESKGCYSVTIKENRGSPGTQIIVSCIYPWRSRGKEEMIEDILYSLDKLLELTKRRYSALFN